MGVWLLIGGAMTIWCPPAAAILFALGLLLIAFGL